MQTTEKNGNAPKARLATLDTLLETTIPAFLDPPPCKPTLRKWFRQARVRSFKPSASAKRGGGEIYYCQQDVERLFTNRLQPA